MGNFIQNSFNAGEWSPLLEGRVDLAKYPSALYKMENFVIDPRGPAMFRPGFRFIKETKTNSTASVLIPFEFSVTTAYILEFGNQYIRFYKSKAQIVSSYAAWTTATAYALGTLVTNGANYYRCLIAHTSGTFATDLTAGKWVATAGATDLAYEIPSPYLAADLKTIKYCQSADVIYLLHPSYAPRKLSRTGDTSWTLSTVNFRPPAIKEQAYKPAATLTLSAVSGASVTATAGSSVFLSSDKYRVITSGVGRASITSVDSGTQVTVQVLDAFASVGPIASQYWSMLGSPYGFIDPTIKGPVGAICQVTSTTSTEVLSDLVTPYDTGANNWAASSAKGGAYYLLNTSECYQDTSPDSLYVDDATVTKVAIGSLSASFTWGWGDLDSLGYDTIYFWHYNGSWYDPDTSGWDVKRGDYEPSTNVFRSGDVGKYIRAHNGVIKITTYTSATSVTGEILKELSAATKTGDWTLETEVWNSTNGYPSCGAFFEERFCLAGCPAYPETIWGSQVGDYENLSPGTDDSDAFEFTLSGREINVIRWIEPREYLVVGAAGAEWRLGPEDTGSALTPLNVVAKKQTSYGSADIPPVTVASSTLFIQRAKRKIREFTYQWESDGYTAPDLTVLAEHATEGSLAGMAFQQEPNSILWGYLEDGSLIGMTYIREQDVVGWHRHPIDGAIESMATIPGAGYDEVWAIVNRTINGSTVRYVEMLEAFFMDSGATYIANKGLNAFFVDCGITYTGAATTTITGLGHLEGEAVVALADGNYVGGLTVASGQITLPTAATVVHVGLPYTGEVQTMRLDAALANGTAQGRVKKINNMTVRVHQSGPFKAGRDASNLDTVYDPERVITLGAPYPLFTGDIELPYDGSWEKEARPMIVQDLPMPMTLIAIMPEVTIA